MSKAHSRLSSRKFTRKLDKKSLLNSSSIYMFYMLSMLSIIKPALISMLHPHVHYSSVLHLPQGHYITSICPDIIFQILLPYSRYIMSHHVTCHMTAISCTTSLSKKKSKKRKKKVK